MFSLFQRSIKWWLWLTENDSISLKSLSIARRLNGWIYSYLSLLTDNANLNFCFVALSSGSLPRLILRTQQQCLSPWDIPRTAERTHFTSFPIYMAFHWFTACDIKYLFCSTLIAFFVTVRFSWIQPQLEHILLAHQHSWTTMRSWDAGLLPCEDVQKKVLRNPSGDNLMLEPNYVNLFLVPLTNTTWYELKNVNVNYCSDTIVKPMLKFNIRFHKHYTHLSGKGFPTFKIPDGWCQAMVLYTHLLGTPEG